MGDTVVWAQSYYVNFLNQTRVHKHLLPDPVGTRLLNPITPVKWALLQVLSTRCELTKKDIVGLFAGLSYRRGTTAISRGLHRLVKFGLAVTNKHRYPRKHFTWVLTERGKQLAPPTPGKSLKPMTTGAKEVVRVEIETRTSWVSVDDLATKLSSIKPATISRALRYLTKTGYLKKEVVPDDRYRRKQWAVATKDTTGWVNATPTVAPAKVKRVKKTTTASAAIVTQPMYGGVTLMCAPINKPSLIKAVGDLVVNEILPANAKFSAYDVTKKLREKLLQEAMGTDPNNPTVDPSEVGTVYVQGHSIPKVEHDDVKSIVHELFQSGVLSGYARIHNGKYFEYDLAASVLAPTPLTVSIDPGSAVPVVIDGGSYDGNSTI